MALDQVCVPELTTQEAKLMDALIASAQDREPEPVTQKSCVPEPTTQTSSMMGHNKPPKGRVFGLGAAWLHFADSVELARLAVLHVRIQRKEQALRDLRSQRTTIMHRCITRMRRAAGKN